MNIIFSEGSGLNDSVFGRWQAPISMFLEKRGEAFEQKSMLGEFFVMGKSDNFADTFTGLTAMSGFKPVGENGEYPADGMQEGYKKMLEYPEWKDSFAISQKMVEDAKLVDIERKSAGFMNAFGRTRERFGAALYGGAIAGKSSITFEGMRFDITGADGQPLFSKNHKPMVSGEVQSNLFSNEFSAEALDMAESAMHQFRGDNNEVLDVSPVTIAIPDIPSLKRKVFAVIGADLDPNSANHGYNFQYGRWNVKIWTYLNQFVAKGVEPWMLLDDDYNKLNRGAVWNDRVPLTVRSELASNDANVWKGRARWGAAFNDFRFACLGGITGGTDLTTLKI